MLRLTNIEKTFDRGTASEKEALKSLNLEVPDGDFVTIVGSNGAGKSTLFNLIAGKFYADCGNIILDNENITFTPDYKRSRSIGYLFQDPHGGTAPNMTILENLTLANSQGKKSKEYYKDRLSSLELGLENRLSERVGSLSGGERQALTLLMATLTKPRLLLLDEHTAALDPKTADKILGLTEKIVRENKTTCLMITHNLKNALNLGNRTLMMAKGKIKLDIGAKERENMTEEDLIKKFNSLTAEELSDRALLREE